MNHKVFCASCGKTERIEVKKGELINNENWHYYGKININACQTDKYVYKVVGNDINKLERMLNPCYDSKVKKKYVELWFCKECDEDE